MLTEEIKLPQRHKAHKAMDQKARADELSGEIISAAIEVHKNLGPGLLESAYQKSLAHELSLRGIPYKAEVQLPLEYKNHKLDVGYRLDLLVADLVIVEIKSVEKLLKIHEAQLLTYLRLTNTWLGLLLNFNVFRLKQGIRRLVLG